MNQWYVIKTKPHKEEDVAKLLSLAKLKTLHPKINNVSYRGTIPHLRMSSLFPCYLFLNTDFSDFNLIHMVRFTRGVSQILCSNGKPHPLSQDVINTILQRVDSHGIISFNPHQFRTGEPVRVTKGILKDLIGILEKPCLAHERVTVLLKLVNYNIKASLHWTEIEKIKVA
jgi:transcription antitermination factor NusG